MEKVHKIFLNCGHEVESMADAVDVEYVEDGGLVFATYCKECAAAPWLAEAESEVGELKKKWGDE